MTLSTVNSSGSDWGKGSQGLRKAAALAPALSLRSASMRVFTRKFALTAGFRAFLLAKQGMRRLCMALGCPLSENESELGNSLSLR